MLKTLQHVLERLRDIAAALDTGHAVRHGLPVPERARRRCAHRGVAAAAAPPPRTDIDDLLDALLDRR